LTNRQREIFDLIAKGKSNKDIINELFIELSTLKTHINKIYKTLGITNRKEAIAMSNIHEMNDL
jgi:ATP/maltotriose-dependent transcriptional regulator MalT